MSLRRHPSVPQPKQLRSRNTRERLVKAAEDLLARQDFGGMTVRQIATRAHASMGTFYKHFPSKRDLLPLLVDRLQSASAVEAMELTLGQLATVSLASRVACVVRLVADTTTRQRNVLRACVAARFSTDLTLSSIQMARSRRLLRRLHDWLLERRHEITHPDPPMAVRVGLYLSLQSLQTALLFEQLPTSVPPILLIREAERMLLSYLRQ
jgi:AcrR family transcriptional regulator